MGTASAFCKARKKLRYEAFLYLNSLICNLFESSPAVSTWNNHRVMTFDGTTIRLPGDKCFIEQFGSATTKGARKVCIARASSLYDPLNKLTLDLFVTTTKTGEVPMALAQLEKFEDLEGRLFLMDRGYDSFSLLKKIDTKGGSFVCRLKSGRLTRQCIESGKDDLAILFTPPKSRKSVEKYGIPTTPFLARIVRVPHHEQDIFLLTNLHDTERFSSQSIIEAYRLRWDVETNFRLKKALSHFENFSARTVHGVLQEIHARVFSENLAAILKRPVAKQIERKKYKKHKHRLNDTQVLSSYKRHLVVLLAEGEPASIINKIWLLWSKMSLPIRKGRHYERIGFDKSKNPPKAPGHHPAFKGI